jgi:hypothetical protein
MIRVARVGRSRCSTSRTVASSADVEFLQLLAQQQQRTLKWMLREERHPGEPDAPADRQ